jgi:hypothetical protein
MGKYKITGILRNGKRFAAIHTDSRQHALSINLWCGTVWQMDSLGKYRKIKQVIN